MSDIKATALAVNYSLMKLITSESEDSERVEIKQDQPLSEDQDLPHEKLNLSSVIEVLNQLLHHNSVQTKVAVLRWILHLYSKVPFKVKCDTINGNF